MNDIRDRMLALIPNLGVFAVVLAIGVSMLGSFTAPKPGDKKAAEPAKAADPPPSAPPPVGGKPQPPHVRFLQSIDLYPTDKQILEDLAWRPLLGETTKQPEPGVDEYAPYRERCDYLIVTVPDPIETQFGFWFDQCVEAVQMAMSAAGNFTLEHSWYPWRAGKGKRTDEFGPADHQKHPGVIVFRDSQRWKAKRVVLLVGENPVTGVHKFAMTEALKLAERMDHTCTPAKSETPNPVRVVGPFFSGGQPSLASVVQTWARSGAVNRERVSAISGSATALIPHETTFREAWYGTEKHERSVVHKQRSTVAPNEVQRKAVLHYLARHERAKPQDKLCDSPKCGVAYLIEANSGFGEGAARDVGRNGVPPLTFRFPMHLSKLAGIQSKERRERDERLGLAPAGGMLTALDETRSGADSLPAADEARTALLNQTLLTDHWATVRRAGAKYVGIIASDPRDKIFLIEQLREQMPEVVPFVFGYDKHFAHPEYAPFLRGTLVAGSYQLYPPAQNWSKRDTVDERRLVFASTAAEGVYNATVIQFGHEDRLLDYHPPAWGPPGNGRPPVWVSVVAEDGKLVPLAYFTNYHDSVVYEAHDPLVEQLASVTGPAAVSGPLGGRSYSPPLPTAVWVWATAVLVAAGWAGFLLVRHLWQWPAATRSWLRLVTAGAWVAGGLVVAAGTLAVYAVAVEKHAPQVVRAHPWKWGWVWLSVWACAAVVAGYAGVTLVVFGRFVCRWPLFRPLDWLARRRGLKLWCWVTADDKSAIPRPRWLPGWGGEALSILYAGGVLAGTAALVWGVAEQLRSLDSFQQVLFLERAGWVARGSSVLVPAVLLAAGLYSFGARRLAATTERAARDPGSPYPDATTGGPFGEQFGHIHDQARRLDGTVFDLGYMLRRNWPLKLILAAVVGGATAFLVTRGHRTWEGSAWDWLFAVGFVVLGGLALRSAVRLLAAWQVLERMLRTVARLPMVGAFDRLPDKVVRMLSGFLLTTNPRWGDLAICHHLLRQLREAVAVNPDGFRPDLVPPSPSPVLDDPLFIWDDPATPRSPADQWRERPRELTDEQRRKLMAYSRELVSRLTPGWKTTAVLEAFGKRAGKDPGETDLTTECGWRRIAEQFVAIQVVVYLAQFFARLRHLATSGALTAALLLVGVTAYPFQPEQPIMAAGVLVAAVVTAAVMWVFYRMNRNEIVSRLARTTPDKFTLDGKFLTSMVQFVVPLVLLVVAQLSGRLRSLFEPALELFR